MLELESWGDRGVSMRAMIMPFRFTIYREPVDPRVERRGRSMRGSKERKTENRKQRQGTKPEAREGGDECVQFSDSER